MSIVTPPAKSTPQQRANIKQNEVRKGQAVFTTVRLSNFDEKDSIDSVVKKYGGTRREALIAAFKALDGQLAVSG
ncbi:MAG: hypothetical protein HAW67_03520 [Endozoicomonadaceae bacterium]|nr:hypothetical protein [Endozoicomonadaceae bacterium]